VARNFNDRKTFPIGQGSPFLTICPFRELYTLRSPTSLSSSYPYSYFSTTSVDHRNFRIRHFLVSQLKYGWVRHRRSHSSPIHLVMNSQQGFSPFTGNKGVQGNGSRPDVRREHVLVKQYEGDGHSKPVRAKSPARSQYAWKIHDGLLSPSFAHWEDSKISFKEWQLAIGLFGRKANLPEAGKL
jgi:hypothetical protein